MLAQIPAAPSGAIETWLLSFAAIASIAVLAKKLFQPKGRSHPEYATKTELYEALTEIRDKIEAGFKSTNETIRRTENFLFRTGELRTASLHRRLAEVQETVARLDERTKSRPSSPDTHDKN